MNDLEYQEFYSGELELPELNFLPSLPDTMALLETVRSELEGNIAFFDLELSYSEIIQPVIVDVTSICQGLPVVEIPIIPEHLPVGVFKTACDVLLSGMRFGLLFLVAIFTGRDIFHRLGQVV